MTLWQRLALTTGATLILWAISERIFWSVVRPDDSLGGIAMSLIPYWFATFFTLWGIAYFRVHTLPGLIVMGAFYGWFVEALVAMTLFGGAGIPLPFSISWTGLSWHMLISVVFVWYLHRLAMGQSFMRSLAYSAGLGLFWAFWSMAWFFETPPIINDLGLYLVHAFAITLLMMLGHVLMSRGGSVFVPSLIEKILTLGVVALYTYYVTVPTLGVMAGVILVLAAVLYIPLRRERAQGATETVIGQMTTPVPFSRILTLLITPVIAVGAYALWLAMPGVLFQFNVATLFVTTPLGFGVLGWAIWRIYKPKAVPMPVPPLAQEVA
jgi:hypothetical protein